MVLRQATQQQQELLLQQYLASHSPAHSQQHSLWHQTQQAAATELPCHP
jgi:hypothetical protein